MIVFLEKDLSEFSHFRKRFLETGEYLAHYRTDEFKHHIQNMKRSTDNAIEAVIINSASRERKLVGDILKSIDIPVIVLTERRTLDDTRFFFEAGADDVVSKPVHPEELVMRIASIKRRISGNRLNTSGQKLSVYFDGREPEFGGKQILLPRRQKRILEYLIFINGRRATKSQIFEAVYDIHEGHFDEAVIESHISRLRKKLRETIGHDPVNSQRHLGYQLDQRFTSLRKHKHRKAA